MRIEFVAKTKAVISDIDIQSLKMGHTEVVPAVCLHLKLTLANSTLAMLDKHLLNFLFQRNTMAAKQQALEGVPTVSDLPELTDSAIAIGAINWAGEQTGTKLVIYQGMTGDLDITLNDCTVRKIKIDPKEGGAVEWDMQVYTSDVDQKTIGALGVLKSLTRDIEVIPAHPVSERQQSVEEAPSGKKKKLSPEEALQESIRTGATSAG